MFHVFGTLFKYFENILVQGTPVRYYILVRPNNFVHPSYLLIENFKMGNESCMFEQFKFFIYL
jgi:hypothetical protein